MLLIILYIHRILAPGTTRLMRRQSWGVSPSTSAPPLLAPYFGRLLAVLAPATACIGMILDCFFLSKLKGGVL